MAAEGWTAFLSPVYDKRREGRGGGTALGSPTTPMFKIQFIEFTVKALRAFLEVARYGNSVLAVWWLVAGFLGRG